MIDNEDVDDDYFTPIAKTSLANIFRKPFPEEKTNNETLKYTPPSPKAIQNQDETKSKKAYENIFSCVFNAYLWLDNVYTHKGKLGFAVVRLTTDNQLSFHSILLYDSNKTTLSTTVASNELEVTVKGKDFISYYDNYQKYWCLYGSDEDIKKAIDILKTCNVTIKVLKDSDKMLPEQSTSVPEDVTANTLQLEPEKGETDKTLNTIKKNIGSDTDSSINRKTKASILSRMANMGQSVLPSHTVTNELSSYSSDSNESDNHIVAVKPKPSIAKKSISEKNMFQQQRSNISKKGISPRIHHFTENKSAAGIEDQLMPLQTSNIIASTSGNEQSFFITEQRIANSELRINITRMTDKVDHVLNKIDNLELRDKKEVSINFNNEILLKLLKEYEDKIKTYEDLLQKNCNVELNSSSIADTEKSENRQIINKEIKPLRNKIQELVECIKQKDEDISVLNKEIESLRGSNNSQTKDDLLSKISELKEELCVKDELLLKSTAQSDDLFKKSLDDQLESKVKIIMNDTFRAAAANFERTESYSGEEIHNILAAVIKKVTMESFHTSK